MWVEPGAFEPLECIYVTKYYGTLEIFEDIFFCILASWATWIDILKNTSLPQIYLLFIFSSMIDLEPPTLVQKVTKLISPQESWRNFRGCTPAGLCYFPFGDIDSIPKAENPESLPFSSPGKFVIIRESKALSFFQEVKEIRYN